MAHMARWPECGYIFFRFTYSLEGKAAFGLAGSMDA